MSVKSTAILVNITSTILQLVFIIMLFEEIDIYLCTKETFFQDFQVILKQTLH